MSFYDDANDDDNSVDDDNDEGDGNKKERGWRAGQILGVYAMDDIFTD